jgi:hypothetical protein
MPTFIKTIGSLIASIPLIIGSFVGIHQQSQNTALLGDTVYQPITQFETSVAISIDNVSTSTLTLVSGVDRQGNALSGNMCFTLDSGTSLLEYLCGSASGTTVTGLVRGIDPVTGITSVPALAHVHRVGADVKITDAPYLSQWYRLLSGVGTFPNVLQYSNSVTNSAVGSSSSNLASVGYVNSTSFAGAPNGSLTVKGIYQEATQAQMASGTSAGSTGADLVAPNRWNSLTASTSPVNVIASGTIDPSYLLNGNYSLNSVTSASTTLNGTTTLPNVTSSLISTNASGSITKTSALAFGQTAGAGAACASGTYGAFATSTITTGANSLFIIGSASRAAAGALNDSDIFELLLDGAQVGNTPTMVCNVSSQCTTEIVANYVATTTAGSHTIQFACNKNGGTNPPINPTNVSLSVKEMY